MAGKRRNKDSVWFATDRDRRKRPPLTVTLGDYEWVLIHDMADENGVTVSRAVCMAIRALRQHRGETLKALFTATMAGKGRGTRPEGFNNDE